MVLIFPLTHSGEHLCTMLFVPRSQKCVNTEAMGGMDRAGVLNSAVVTFGAPKWQNS